MDAEKLEALDLRPKDAELTNSRWGNSDVPDDESGQLAKINETSVAAVFFNHAAEQGDRLYSSSKTLDDGTWKELTWGEAATEVARLAYFLREKFSIQPGDKVAILSASRHEWTITDLAILSLGAISIPVYQTLAAGEVAYILFDSEAEVVFVENQEQLDKLEIIDSAPIKFSESETHNGDEVRLKISSVICFEEVDTSQFVSRKFDFKHIVENTNNICPENTHELVESFRSSSNSISRDSLASIVYTSGTTGDPKGVVQTHGNHLSMLGGLKLSGLLAGGSGIFLFLPLAHSFARLIFYGVIVSGGDMIFTAVTDKKKSAFSAKQMFEDIAESGPVVFPAVPRMFEKVMTGVLGKAEAAGFIKGALVRWSLKNYKPLIDKGANNLSFIEKLKYNVSSAIVEKNQN